MRIGAAGLPLIVGMRFVEIHAFVQRTIVLLHAGHAAGRVPLGLTAWFSATALSRPTGEPGRTARDL